MANLEITEFDGGDVKDVYVPRRPSKAHQTIVGLSTTSQATSSAIRNDATWVRIFASVDFRIAFGDSAVVADASSEFCAGGQHHEFMVGDNSALYIAAITA